MILGVQKKERNLRGVELSKTSQKSYLHWTDATTKERFLRTNTN